MESAGIVYSSEKVLLCTALDQTLLYSTVLALYCAALQCTVVYHAARAGLLPFGDTLFGDTLSLFVPVCSDTLSLCAVTSSGTSPACAKVLGTLALCLFFCFLFFAGGVYSHLTSPQTPLQ